MSPSPSPSPSPGPSPSPIVPGWPRIGSGIDVHAFAAASPGASVVLAGVVIPSDAPLEGHSDADVVAHAVIDALLGAAGLGDIGARFGVDDPMLSGADSMALLLDVVGDLRSAGWRPGNVDVTVVAARPRVSAHREAMRERLAGALGVTPADVSIKATTTDGLGSIGRAEGVAAWAVALVVPGEQPGEQPGGPGRPGAVPAAE
jgi:2-C-methyl-D-erythritol 2,4-cyclodiphosphate synthase